MSVIHVESMEHFKKLASEHKLLVCDFTATWCGPCRRIAPVFEALAEEEKTVAFLKIDVDENPDLAGNFAVRSMPTFTFVCMKTEHPAYHESNIVHKFSGSSEEKLREGIILLKTSCQESVVTVSDTI